MIRFLFSGAGTGKPSRVSVTGSRGIIVVKRRIYHGITDKILLLMKNIRKYGKAPYNVAVIHGGPGAPGEMAPVARTLSSRYGVLEPLQTAPTLDAQVEELKSVLQREGKLPVTLVGFSWGAMLSYMFTALNPEYVKKLILVSSGVFEQEYAESGMQTRLSRLNRDEQANLHALVDKLDDPVTADKDAIFRQCKLLYEKADTMDPLPHKDEVIGYQYDMFENVWNDAEKLRRWGNLVPYGRHITCPVVAIHGDYDPHPADGINIPLKRTIPDFRFILLENCGHCPWQERNAHDRFYEILNQELA